MALPASSPPDRRTLLSFVFIVLLGGSNAVAVRLSNVALPPFWGAAARFMLAALIFWVVVAWRRIPLPRGRALTGAMLFGAMTVGIFYALVYWALVSVTASVTMVVLAIGPLLTFFFAVLHGQEIFRWRGLLGALIAFGGILLAIGDQVGDSLPLLPLLALLAGAASLGEGTVLYKRFPAREPLLVNAIALTVGSAILLLISLLVGEAWLLPAETSVWLAFGYLVLGGSVALFYLYLYVLDRWTASATSYAFLLFPVATIIMAAWLADEAVSPRFLLGGAVVLFGVWLGALSQPATKTAS